MVIEIDTNVPSELVPLSWLIGVWEGSGLVNRVIISLSGSVVILGLATAVVPLLAL